MSTSSGRRTDARTPSRLSRRALFARWQRLQEQASQAFSRGVQERLSRQPSCVSCLCAPQLNGAGAAQASYSGWKAAAGRYQGAMQNFISALRGAGLGSWLRKPAELGHFYSSQEDQAL